MAIVQFGNTWWGEKWLDALTNIDFENRLPRGQRYARNGSVVSIDIDSTSVTAKVNGRRPQPYRVTIEAPAFSKKQANILKNLITESPFYLSQLEARTLPEDLYDDLQEKGIKLFPRSWKDLKMHCTCPDWAVPCKHIAAVIYIIANEIDKNPFLVFNLRNYDLLEAFQNIGKTKEEEIISISSLLVEKPNKCTYYQEKLEHLDFAVIPLLKDPIIKLLTAKPLFYLKGDFKDFLEKQYERMGRRMRKLVRDAGIQEDPPKEAFAQAEFRLYKGKMKYRGVLKSKTDKMPFDSEDLSSLVEYLQVLSIGDLNNFSPVLSFLATLHSFTIRLIEQSAYIPDIISLDQKLYIMRWIPALFDHRIKALFDELVEAMPMNMVKYGDTALQGKDQVLFLTTFFINHYLKNFNPLKDLENDPVQMLFFGGKEFRVSKFEEQEIARTVNLWLSRFFIRPKSCSPVIRIDDTEEPDTYRFNILIQDKRKEIPEPEELAGFLESGNDEKFPVLKDLSLLSTYLPAVNTVLKRKGAVTVSSDSFVAIWFEALPVLNTLGVTTILPKILKDVFAPEMTLKMKKMAKKESINTYLDLQSMLEFEWTMAVGDRFISASEFLKLTKKYSGVVRFKDRYLLLDQKEIERIQKQLEKEPTFSPIDLLRINLDGSFDGVPIKTEKVLQSILKNLFTPVKVDVPGTLRATLRKYQLSGYHWLYHNYKIGVGSLIADDMGLGKTIQVITFLLKLKEEGALLKKKVLIVVPASLATNWQREIEKFAPPLKAAVYHGSKRTMPVDAEIIITTYGLARIDHKQLCEQDWICLITDETQNLKNPANNQTKKVKAIPADVKIAMTGTPVENRLMDYWSIMDFVLTNLLGSKESFKRNFAIPIEKFRDHAKLESFRRITAPFILRRIKTDKTIISDLPEKIEMDRYAQLTKEQAALYQEWIRRLEKQIAEADNLERLGLIFKLMMGLKQICNHPALFLKTGSTKAELSGKGEILLELLKKILGQHQKTLIFTQFKQMGNLLEDMIHHSFGFKPLFLHGGLSRKKRDELVDSFQGDRESKILILSIKAGGTGLNLTAATNVIHYDLWWNPAVETQATDRAFRIGQKKNVNVYRFVTQSTFEEKINQMLKEKKDLADLTVNQGEKWLTELSNSDLKELIRLER
jgi:uncharacterized Zn finger protein